MAEEGVVAGRLEVPVESNTKGFGERLRAAIQKETENIVAKIGVEIEERGLRERIEATVEAASKGVKAKVEAVVDTKRAKAELEALGGKVHLDAEGLTEEVRKQSWLAQLFAKKNPIKYPVKPEKSKGFFASLAAIRAEGEVALAKKPMKIPLAPATGRGAFFPLLILGVLSLIQPLVATIGGALGGLGAMLGNLASGVQVLAAAPALLSAFAGGAVATMLSVKALSGEIDKLPKPLQAIRREFEGLQKPWKAIQTDTALAFWRELKGDVKATGEKLLPLLNTGMRAFGTTMGQITDGLAAWARTPLFGGQFSRLMASGNVVLAALGKTLTGVVKGFMNIADAATIVVGERGGGNSLIGRLAGFLEGAGKWAANIAKPGKAAKEFAEELGYAADKVSQLWDMLKDLGAGIKGVFRAGRDSGDRLLGSFGDFLNRWRTWVESGKGQASIKKWFADVEPIAKEAGRLLADLGKALVKMSADPNVTALLKQIRTEILPGLVVFLDNLGKHLGPQVVTFVSEVVDALTRLSDAGSPLAVGLGYINTALGGLATILKDNPGMAKTLGTILGGLLAFRALAFVGNASGILTLLTGLSKLLKGGGLLGVAGLTAAILPFTGALNGLSPALQGVVTALGIFMALRSTLPAMAGIVRSVGSGIETARIQMLLAGDAWKKSGASFGSTAGWGNAAKVVGTTAKSGLRGAVGGLMGVLGLGAAGGPVGFGLAAAFAVVSTAIGIWSAKHAEAAQKAQEYKAHVEEIAASLDKETGALTEATKATVAKKLQDSGAADAAVKYGVNLADLTDAALGNADAQSRVRKALADNVKQWILNQSGASDFQKSLSTAGVTMDAFSASQVTGGKTAQDMRTKVLLAAQAAGIHGIALDTLWTQLEKNTTAQRDLAAKVAAENSAVAAATAKQSQFNAMMDKAGTEVRKVTSALAGLPAGKTTTVSALTATAESKLKAMGYKVTHLPDGTVQISASTAAANAQINYAARSRTATIYVRTVGGRVDGWNAGLQADGSILSFRSFANGGMLDALKGRVQAFADGAERHIAQIARPGDWRIWAEPETGGEAYIPLSPAKRKRSMAILREVADRFGMVLAPKFGAIASAMQAQGSGFERMAAFAGGGLRASDLRDASRPTVVFEYGAVLVQNPVPETASESVTKVARKVAQFGLFGDGG